MRLAIATCAGNDFADRSDAPLMAALHALGVEAHRCDWRDPGLDWRAFRACFVRSTWDWQLDPEAFRAWLRRVDGHTRLFNPLGVQLWGLDKRYLLDLACRGVPTVPSVLVTQSERDQIERLARERGWRRIVIKPALGATSYRTSLVDLDGPNADSWQRENRDFHGDTLIQPYFPSIASEGETSVVCIGGQFSHAVRKSAAAGDFRVQSEFGGSARLVEPHAAERGLAQACLAAIPGATLAARIDMVRDDDGSPRVIECEVVEPELFFNLAPGSAERLAKALLCCLDAR